VNHPDLVREMSQSMTLDLGKPSYITKALAPMLGNGILRSNRSAWAHQRKIIAPQFFMEKVKVSKIQNCLTELVHFYSCILKACRRMKIFQL